MATRFVEGSPDTQRTDYDDGVLVGERLYAQGQEMLRRRQELAARSSEEREKEILKSATFRPKVGTGLGSRSGGDAEKFYSLQTEWLRRKNRQLDKLRDKEELEVKRMLSEHPKASTRSERLLRGKEYKGPVDDWKHREALFRMSHSDKEPSGSFHPTISPLAQQIRRDGAAGERLFKHAAQQQTDRRKAEDAQKRGRAKDTSTGQILFTPVTRRNQVDDHSPTRRTEDEIDMQIKEMLRRGEEAQRRLRKKKTEIEREQGATFQPTLNLRSEQILSRTQRTPVHLRTKEKEKDTKEEDAASERMGDGSARRTRRTRAEIDSSVKDFMDRIERDQKKTRSKIGKLREKQLREEVSECSFRPNISSKSGTLARQRAIQGYSSPETAVVTPAAPTGENLFYAADVSAPPPVSSSPASRRSGSALDATGERHSLAASQQRSVSARVDGEPSYADRAMSEPSAPRSRRVSPPRRQDDSLAQWVEEWQQQERDIDAILRGDDGGHGGHADPHALPPAALGPDPRGSGEGWEDRFSDLQEVLDGWRHLEKQFTSDFDQRTGGQAHHPTHGQ
eukprot:TRINITY_DN3525_c3_g1_i1.p1 TRINITY_DN3525_c3_g1~~TRINITY_DN3525_c3_g1_i1.p1  ORF type:complete len:565 (+),score=100.80 TRINITY_DN3525_c3_g1_i1:123-1817(+)